MLSERKRKSKERKRRRERSRRLSEFLWRKRDGWTLQRIADWKGIPLHAVYRVLKSRNTRDGRRSLSDKEVAEVKVLLKDKDWTQREIAAAFEVGIKTIEGVSRAMKEETDD